MDWSPHVALLLDSAHDIIFLNLYNFLVLHGRWGGGREDKFFARLGKNVISVYETETFTLIDKKSLKVENVVDFTWSPTDPIIAFFVPELGGGNQPARVSRKLFANPFTFIQIN